MSSQTRERQTPTRSVEVRDKRLIKFLSQPLILEEMGPPRILNQFLLLSSLLVAGFLTWAALTEVTETAATKGQIIPAGSVHLVQHLEGGIIEEITVSEGQIVEAGQALIRLQAAAAMAELDQLRARDAGLALQAERLRAFVLDRDAKFKVARGFADLAKDQSDILQLQLAARDSQREVLLSRIEQRRQELHGNRERRSSLEQQIEFVRQQLELRRDLVEKGLEPRVTFIEFERAYSEVRGELAAQRVEKLRIEAALGEAESSLAELGAKLRNEALTEMGRITAELAEVRESAAKLTDRVTRLAINAPVRGIVKGLQQRNIGSVIAPGEVVMEIVPMDEALVAEVRISPRDVGHLRIGQDARVKLTSYDPTRFGSLNGELRRVSASTFQDEEGEPYYKGIIALRKNYLGDTPGRNLVLPGMVVNADVDTGSKTLMKYLLKPIYRAIDGAFHER